MGFLTRILLMLFLGSHLMWWLAHWRSGGDPDALAKGPLSRYQLGLDADATPRCRESACTFAGAVPAPSREGYQAQGRLTLPSEMVLLPPPSQVFHQRYIEHPGSWVARREGSSSDLELSFGSGAPVTGLQDRGPLHKVSVPQAGYVRKAIALAGDRRRVDPSRRDRNGQPLTFDLPREYSEVHFQPLPAELQVVLAEAPVLPPAEGHEVELTIALGGTGARDTVALTARHVATLPKQGAAALPMMTLKLDALQSLRLSMALCAREHETAVPFEQLVVQVGWKGTGPRGTEQPLRVPATAVVRDAAGARVWLALEERAVPVAVRELVRTEQHSVIIEVPGARGLPVRPEDWRALDSAARRAAYLHAKRPDALGSIQLLSKGPVIHQPAAALRPGARVRVSS
jgi:hypothetical protein